MVDFRGLHGESFSSGILEMEDYRCGAGMAGNVVMDFLKVFCGVTVSPEDEFECTVGVVRFFGFKFANICSGKAASAGAVIDLDSDFEFDHITGLENSGFACWDERFGPEHDFAGAGEILYSEYAEWFSGFGHARFDGTNHPSNRVALAWIIEFDFIN